MFGRTIENYKGDFNDWLIWTKNKTRTAYTYDSNGNKLSEVYPSGDTYKWTYDSNDNMLSKIYPNGDTYRWAYNWIDANTFVITKDKGQILSITFKK